MVSFYTEARVTRYNNGHCASHWKRSNSTRGAAHFEPHDIGSFPVTMATGSVGSQPGNPWFHTQGFADKTRPMGRASAWQENGRHPARKIRRDNIAAFRRTQMWQESPRGTAPSLDPLLWGFQISTSSFVRIPTDLFKSSSDKYIWRSSCLFKRGQTGTYTTLSITSLTSLHTTKNGRLRCFYLGHSW